MTRARKLGLQRVKKNMDKPPAPRPTGEFKDQRQWRGFVGLDYKL
jgi:hypothetical protein